MNSLCRSTGLNKKSKERERMIGEKLYAQCGTFTCGKLIPSFHYKKE